MKTLIVGRTKMGSMRCIGALCEDGRSLRLLDAQGHNWLPSVGFDVGQEWDLAFTNGANLRPPHVEDVLVTGGNFVGNVADVRGTTLSRVQPWVGSPSALFNGAVSYTNKHNGYIEGAAPDRSTWFWIPDKDLALRDDGKHYDYLSNFLSITIPKGLTYVGERDPVAMIPAGTLVRVSLARWWRPDGDDSFPERCYVQLSGWY